MPRNAQQRAAILDPSLTLQRGLGIDAEEWAPTAVPTRDFDKASTGPRHRCRGMSPDRLVGDDGLLEWLQRGLGIDAEEWARLRARRVPRVLGLQRGLGIDAEEWITSPSVLSAYPKLQRGLGIDAEECGSAAPRSCGRSSSFNGASASMPRNDLPRALHYVGIQASTGPRHRCRGMTLCRARATSAA